MTDNVAGALCYVLGLITGILFLVIAPYNQNKTVRFHAFQSIFYHVAVIAFWIVWTIISIIMPWFIKAALGLIGLLIGLGVFCLWIFLIYKAYNNEKMMLPIIGALAEKQA